jgi:hypothetical protein
VFQDPPRQRNRGLADGLLRVETACGGIWPICAVIDYATKYCLAATVTPTSRGQDALGCLRRAVVEAERVLDLDDLRADRGVMDVVDADYVICDPTRSSTNAHHVRLTSPSNTAVSVWPLADPLLDWEVPT